MNKQNILFGFVSSKQIDPQDECSEEALEFFSPKRERSQSSMPYEEAMKKDILKAPVTRYLLFASN